KTLAEHATNDFAFTVVQASELNLLQALHRGGFNLSACKLSDGRNLLMTAAINNSPTEIFEFLINNKINDVNDKNNGGRTALMYLAKSDAFNPKNFELLIRAGANVNAINNGGQTALIMATRSRYATDKIRFLLDLGANVSLKDSTGCEALLYANKADCLKPLIRAGANVNATDNHGQTPLILATQRNDADSIRLLLDSGANVSLKDSSDRDAIYYTSQDYNTNCLRILVQHGADIKQQYAYAGGRTLLHKVAQSEHWKNSSYWQALLDSGADVNAKDNSGSTPLEFALDHSWKFTAELDLPRALVRKGATVTYRAKEIMRRRGIKESNLYNNSTNFFFSSWFN
ncbi:MAG: ankyrin repeat domain-containing protein, partial [Selenomonadaceae bacterium]|nr:ankyrin repeat domain-containing protein [Selenomonadaceae bacterium]